MIVLILVTCMGFGVVVPQLNKSQRKRVGLFLIIDAVFHFLTILGAAIRYEVYWLWLPNYVNIATLLHSLHSHHMHPYNIHTFPIHTSNPLDPT